MRIVMAGASGFVGKMLVPELNVRGAELVLLGRSADNLRTKFPGYEVSEYAGLTEALKTADILINLVVVNSDSAASLHEYQAVNVKFAAELAHAAQDAGVRFINVSSNHALEAGKRSAYAQSKRDGVAAVDAVGGDIVHLYLPAIYGATFAGALRHLNSLPEPLARVVFGPISALKPTLSVTRLAEWLYHHARTAPREVVLSDGQAGNITYRAISRMLDLAAAVGGLILFAVPMLVLWALIRKEGDGPAIFAQPRVGRGGQIFTCYKFRTMAIGTKQAGTHEVSSAAVTPLGRKLRRYKLDELPQLWNVLWGNMSLIGPRPCLPVQEKLVRLRREAGVLDIRPGISGLAQVVGVDMSDPKRIVTWDQRYIATRGLILDLLIIFKTLLGNGGGDHLKSENI